METSARVGVRPDGQPERRPGGGSGGAGLEPRLVALVQAYVSYLSGCGTCVDSAVAEASRHEEGAERLDRLPFWRRTGRGTYTEREAAALIWAELVAGGGAEAVRGRAREQARRVFGEPELDQLVEVVATAKGWRRLEMERSGATMAVGACGDRARGCGTGKLRSSGARAAGTWRP